MKEEFTSLMHSELSITKEQEISHRVYTVLLAMNLGRTLDESLKLYGVSLKDFQKYKSKWDLSSSL